MKIKPMKDLNKLKLFLLFSITIFLSACDRGDDAAPEIDTEIGPTEPDSFLQYVNPQHSLAAGTYTVVAATSAAGQTGDFTLKITKSNGNVTTHTGSWANSGGQDELSVNNPNFTVTLSSPGGIEIDLSSDTVDTYLYILDRRNNIMGEDDDSGSGSNARIDLAYSKLNARAYAKAYYAAIDPLNEKDTLEKWQSANGFDQGEQVHITFRDAKDLGYGRDMYARTNSGGQFAVYVRNFSVEVVPGLSYGVVNLDAAIQNDVQHHIGSNAIEYSCAAGVDPCTAADAKFAKFYTFTPEGERKLLTNLDGRGDKAMPMPCITCHGGTLLPLLSDGSFPPPEPNGLPGDTRSQMQALEVDTFEFSDVQGYRREDLESGFKFINEAVLSVYPTVTTQGYWVGDFATELLEGWYGGVGMPSDTFQEDFVPTGWRPNPLTSNPPPGADILYKNVVGPNCAVCHSKRGKNLEDDIDFSTYDKFISYADQIEHYIFERGIMPLSLLNYNNFWRDEDKAPLLGSFLPGFSSGNSDGTVDRPEDPVAVIFAPLNTNVPATLSGEGSVHAKSYSWSITSTPSVTAVATLTGANSARPTFDANENGDYDIRLVVKKDGKKSAAETVTVTVDNSLTLPRNITFNTHIRNILQGATPPNPGCATACHANGLIAGVPLYYTDAQPANHTLYDVVRARVNFDKPSYSLIIRKPSGEHHNGGCRPGFNLDGSADPVCLPGDGSVHYDTFVSWILEGAVEN